MKARLILLLSILMLQTFLFAENTVTKIPPTTQAPSIQEPDFSPPKDLKGPVFPPEEFIKPPDPETNRFLNEFVSTMATLGLIISFILIFAWFLKKMMTTKQEQANVSSLIKVIERRSISPKSVIYLLEIEGQSIVIAESINGITSLTHYKQLEDSEALASDQDSNIPSAFSKLLNNPNS